MLDIINQIDKNLDIKSVGIEEFCESEEFCGKRLYPRQKVLLKLMFLEELSGKEEDILTYWINGGRNGSEIIISPKIRERMDFLRDHGYKHFREIVLVGGRRSSKGYITGLAMAKVLFDTVQLQDPGLYYGIDPDKEIYFTCVAASQDQAKKYQYADFSASVTSCNALAQNITKVHELEFSLATAADQRKMEDFKRQKKKIARDISKLRGAAFAANASTIRGSATLALVMDEMAHMQQEGESAATAASVYDAAIPALAQFGKDAIIMCNSSPYTKLGKFYERFEEAVKLDEGGNPVSPFSLAFKFPSWALFEGWQDDPSRRFRKAITVSPDWNPEDPHHSDEDRDAILIERDNERQDPDNFKVERRAEWAEVVDSYLRPEAVDYAFDGIPHRDGTFTPLLTNWDNSSYTFKYKMHLDPSSTTAGFGFAMGHIEMLENEHGEQGQHVVFDIVKRWQPREFREGVIDWEIVLREVFGYIQIFEPFEVTFDQFQSGAPIQWLSQAIREKNLPTRVYEKTATAQHNWHRAEIFRTALYQGLVHAPADTPDAVHASQELKYLQQMNTAGRFPRVDKQDIGPVRTKDMADAMMEVVEGLIGNVIAQQTREQLNSAPSVGAPGGFRIGGLQDRLNGNLPGEWESFYGNRRTEARERLSQIGNPGRRHSWGGRGRKRSF